MKKSRYSEEQIIGILKEHEAGMKTAELCRKHNISAGTFYQWKAKFGGLDVNDAKKLRHLEQENAKLKRGVIPSSPGWMQLLVMNRPARRWR